MLTSVNSSSLALSQLIHAEPLTGKPISQDQDIKAKTPRILTESDVLKNKVSKLADLLIGSPNSIANPLIKLALAVARAIDLQQRPQEVADAYRQRLIDVLLAMNPGEQAEVEVKSNLGAYGITLSALAEAMKDIGAPTAAKLMVLIEKASTANEAHLSFEDQAAHVYGDDSHYEIADSLKYRATPSQAGILSTPSLLEDKKPTELKNQKSAEVVSNQTQLVRALIDELFEAAVSLNAQTPSGDDRKSDGETTLSDFAKNQVSQVRLDPLLVKAMSTSVTVTNQLTSSGESGSAGQSAPEKINDEASNHAFESVGMDATGEPLFTGHGVSRTDADKLAAPLKVGILAMISERLMRLPSLTPKPIERQPSTPTTIKTPISQDAREPALATATHQRTPIALHDPAYLAKLTTLFLKDLPAATLAKLEIIADFLLANEFELLTEYLTDQAESKESSTEKPAPTTPAQISDGLVQEKDLAFPARTDSSRKLEQAGPFSDVQLVPKNDLEQPAPSQNRNPSAATPSSPVERITQQIQLFNALAFTSIPYPIVDDQEPPPGPQKDNRQEEREEHDRESDRKGSQSDRDGQHKNQDNKQDELPAEADNPFAPEVELKRHSTEAERAFHMYQKMGGF